jgi:hypothetical protein
MQVLNPNNLLQKHKNRHTHKRIQRVVPQEFFISLFFGELNCVVDSFEGAAFM